MGDVSQNIRYETDMNDWEDLKKILFQKEQDSFYLLAKSYRNTIEISECAGKVLEKASQGSYKIQPVIRHDQEVQVHMHFFTLPLPELCTSCISWEISH